MYMPHVLTNVQSTYLYTNGEMCLEGYTPKCYLWLYLNGGIGVIKNLFATTWMDLEGIMLNELSQKEKDKYHTISLICGI